MPVISFDDAEDASAMAEWLREEGFEAVNINEAMEQMLRLYNLHPKAHCKVWVPMESADAVTNLLQSSNEVLIAKAARCPDCKSFRVEYPQFSRNTIVGSLPAAAAALGLMSRKYYCSACHFTWDPPTDPKDTVPTGKDVIA